MRTLLVAVVAVLVLATPAAAAPTNVSVTQEGTSLRINWTADPGADSHSVEVSNRPDFARGDETCFDFLLGTATTTLMRCLIMFNATIYVRVTPTGGPATVVQVPQAGFSFTPAPLGPQPQPVAVRNRQTVRCATAATDWATVDAGTVFGARIVGAGVERATGDLRNPISGEGQIFVQDSVLYRVQNADVGHPLRCEVTATQGAYAATRVAEGVVGHAPPAEMDPKAMLSELGVPKGYIVYTEAKRKPLRRAEARGGALSKGVLNADYGVSGDLDLTVTIYAKPAQADAGLDRRVCRDLRRAYKRHSTRRRPRAVLACGRVRLANARRVFSALAFGAGINDLGERIAVLQTIVIGSAGNAHFQVSSTAGGSYRERARLARRANRAADLMTPRLALAAARE